MTIFTPKLETLPLAQQKLWPDFARLPREFVLYGGTAAALHLGHRISVDFDFFTSSPLDREALRARFSWLADAQTIQDEPSSFCVSAEIDGAPVKISFFGNLRLGRVAPIFWTQDGVLPVAAPLDLLAHKLKTILQRAQAKDYQDIAALLAAGIELAGGLAAAQALFGNSFATAEALRAISYFDDLLEPERVSQADRARLREAVAQAPQALPKTTLLAPTIDARG